jgi:hypothetical protein
VQDLQYFIIIKAKLKEEVPDTLLYVVRHFNRWIPLPDAPLSKSALYGATSDRDLVFLEPDPEAIVRSTAMKEVH